MMDLRCIRGKHSDWYSEFGYFNQNKAQIAAEMARINAIPYGNSSLGPWLYSLWNKSDKTDFHRAYQYNLWRFFPLTMLKDSDQWIVHFD